jgi:uridine kinase
MKPYVIGIAGGSGSGKSTFAKRIKEAFDENVSLISCDNYYLPHNELTLEERAGLNYDAPEALEFELMVRHLETLKKGQAVTCPIYDFTQHTAVPTLANTEAFYNIPADCEIRVPAALADEWKAATNWSTYASKIVGV